MISLSSTSLFSHYEPTTDDLRARKDLEALISCPGPINQAVSHCLNTLSLWTPTFVKSGLAFCGSYVVDKTLSSYSLRNELKYLAFGSDNAKFAQYDSILPPQEIIPEKPMSIDILYKLLESAQPEREHWHNGKMSGGIYDGSQQHMEALANFFRMALSRDEQNRSVFPQDEPAFELAVKAFADFQTANPLHGNLFPLAVKSMREIGYMLASLVHKRHAIVSSGGEEALRIALKALKNRHRKDDKQCIVRTIGDSRNMVNNVANTLNIRAVSDPAAEKEAHFAVLYLTEQNLDSLNLIGKQLSDQGLDLHIHFDNSAFKKFFSTDDRYLIKKVFKRFRSTRSVSFDTDKIFYQGLSATIFDDAERRYQAFEAHIDWSGGIYPGINAAGSLPGIDYIIAYLSILLNGKSGLAALAEKARPAIDPPLLDRNKYLDYQNSVIEKFNSHQMDSDILQKMRNDFLPNEWQPLMENLLKDTTLSIFQGLLDDFSTQITSGGTESIRIAMLTYFNRFKHRFPHKTPIFLMTKTAHIAFDRQIKDFDGLIIRIKENQNVMDLEDLKKKIAEVGNENIAAIVASTPNYPIGTSDPIREIANMAWQNDIPLHVDACLGAYVTQFLSHNPVAIRLDDPSLKGITSWSADIHKYGLTQKGLSFVACRKREDLIMPSRICKQRSSTQLEVGLACMLKIGRQGYQDRAQSIIKLAKELKKSLIEIKDLEIIDISDDVPHFVIAFRLREPLTHLTYTLASFMGKLGWHLSQVGRYTLHVAITNAHTYNEQFLPKFMSDMTFVVETLHKHPHLKQSSSVGLYGMAACPRELSLVPDNLKDEILSGMLKLYAENLVE